MGNNHPFKIVGIGLVRIKTYDGVVRTLVRVRHVPEKSHLVVHIRN